MLSVSEIPTRNVLASEKGQALKVAVNILILGGTGFIGPYFVRAALARFHNVAVFTRGDTQCELPREVERLTGDRSGNLASLQDRDWDSVIDLAVFGPA